MCFTVTVVLHFSDTHCDIRTIIRVRNAHIPQQFQQIFELLEHLFNPPDAPERRRIGFK